MCWFDRCRCFVLPRTDYAFFALAFFTLAGLLMWLFDRGAQKEAKA